MNDRLRRLSPYLPAAVICLMTAAIAWQLLGLAGASSQAFLLGRRIAKWEQPAAEDQADAAKSDKQDAQAAAPAGETPKPDAAATPSAPKPDAADQKKKKDTDKYAPILTKGLFSKQKQKPVPGCTGVLGDCAIIDNKLVKLGDKVGEWTLAEIGVNKVVLTKDEEKRELQIFPELKSK